MKNHPGRINVKFLIAVTVIASALAGCGTVTYYDVPHGKPQAELTVSMPKNSSISRYVSVGIYSQAEKCIDLHLTKNYMVMRDQVAANQIEAGRLQTVHLTLVDRSTGQHQVLCHSMLSLLPEEGGRYQVQLVDQGAQCSAFARQVDTNGTLIRTEHKVRTPVAHGFFKNDGSDCSDKVMLK